jgi:Protein of unknown function (DUF2510)
MTQTGQPAGWYADPSRRHERRYWDGSQWGDDVSDAGLVSHDQATPNPPPAPAEATQATPSRAAAPSDIPPTAAATAPPVRRKRSRAGIVWLAILAAVLFVVGIVGFAVGRSADSDKDKYETEQALIDAKNVDAEKATSDIEAAQQSVDVAIGNFRTTVDAALDAHNAMVGAYNTALCGSPSPLATGCFGTITQAEAQDQVRPAVDAYSAAIDAEQNAFAQVGQAVASLQEALK